ncbi:MAG: YncE family protein [Acidimicrobiales bacterium]
MGATRQHGAIDRRRPGVLPSGARAILAAAASLGLGGCSLVTAPAPPTVSGPSMAPPGSIGYVACPNAVTPVELATDTPEADIPLPISGTPAPGDFAIAASANGQWAYVVTTDGVSPSPSTGSSAPVTTGAATTAPGPTGQNVVIPVNLVTQQAETPIDVPGTGGTHGIVVMPGGTIVLAASGEDVVPVDVATRQVGAPLDLGPTHAIYGMALDPAGTTLFVLVAGGVIPVDTVHATAGTPIATGLAVSSLYSPNGIAVTGAGSIVYVIGQGGSDYGGRVLPIDAATRAPQAQASFDRFGIAAPAAVAVSPDGGTLYVVDSADNWVNPLPVAAFASPPAPVRLPVDAAGGTQHPTDIVLGPGGSTAYIVEGFDSVIPYATATQSFGQPMSVCAGAASMTVAPSPSGAASS